MIFTMHQRLVFELTQLDQRESKRERTVNIYRLSHYLGAAAEVEERVAEGVTFEEAFSETFTPTRGMHKVARNLGLRLDVERGNWIIGNEEG